MSKLVRHAVQYAATQTSVLLQAASNAKHNHGMSKVKLYVSEAYADEALFFKRLQYRAMGRYGPMSIRMLC